MTLELQLGPGQLLTSTAPNDWKEKPRLAAMRTVEPSIRCLSDRSAHKTTNWFDDHALAQAAFVTLCNMGYGQGRRAYFHGRLKAAANWRENFRDRRLVKNQNDKRQDVVVIRQRERIQTMLWSQPNSFTTGIGGRADRVKPWRSSSRCISAAKAGPKR